MGGFYDSIHLRTENRDKVLSVLQHESRGRCWIGPPIGGWLSLYPAGGGQNGSHSQQLAHSIDCPMIHVTVHDDDFLAYWYYRDGKLRDQFNSLPDYFGEVSASVRKALKGKPRVLRELLKDQGDFAKLREYLSRPSAEQPAFAVNSLKELAALLGLPNPIATYESLQGGNIENIDEWNHFVHVPDLSFETKIEHGPKSLFERPLQTQALLYRQQSWATNFKQQKSLRPLVCSAPNNGFIALWTTPGKSSECQIALHSPPTFQATQRHFPHLSTNAQSLASSSTKRLLGVGNAASNWTADVWDVEAQQRVLHTPTGRFISFVGFTPDESHFVTISEEEMIVTHVESAKELIRFSIPKQIRRSAAFHPSGLLIVSSHNGSVSLFDVIRGTCLKSFYPSGFEVTENDAAAAIERKKCRAEKQFDDGWEDRMRNSRTRALTKTRGDLETRIEKGETSAMSLGAFDTSVDRMLENEIASIREALTRRQQGKSDFITARGKTRITSLTVSPCGKWIGCGTETGAFVLAWNAIEQSPGGIIEPAFGSVGECSVCAPSGNGRVDAGYAQAGALDTNHNEYLFAGEDGLIRMLNLKTGIDSCLPAAIDRLGIVQMELSSDGSNLCCVRRSLSDQKQPWSLEVWNYKTLYEQRHSSR